MTDRTVPTEPTPEMIEAGCRALHEMQGTGDADAPMHSPYQNSWDEPDSVRWRQWIHTIAGDEEDIGVYRAMLAASPAAPGAEVEPVAGLPPIEVDPDMPSREYIPLPGGWEVQTKGRGSSYRLLDRKTGERHLILCNDGNFIHDFVTRMAKEVHAASSPPTTDAIKAQARREALEEAARIVDAECKRILSQQDGLIPEVDTQLRMIALLLPDIALSIRRLAGKPEEAEGYTQEWETVPGGLLKRKRSTPPSAQGGGDGE